MKKQYYHLKVGKDKPTEGKQQKRKYKQRPASSQFQELHTFT